MRKQMGKHKQPFDFCVSLLEPLNRDISEELEHHGAHNKRILPWLITPWGHTPWLLEGEDPTLLDTINRVLERIANSVIQS